MRYDRPHGSVFSPRGSDSADLAILSMLAYFDPSRSTEATFLTSSLPYLFAQSSSGAPQLDARIAGLLHTEAARGPWDAREAGGYTVPL